MIGAPLRVRVLDRDRIADGADLDGLATGPGAGPDAVAAWAVAERDGRPYRGVWILVTSRGRPVGELELELPVDGRALAVALAEADRPGVSAPTAGDPAPPGPLPLVTVVLPTDFRRVELLRRAVAEVAALDYPHFEVLVVDNRPGRADGPPPYLGPAADDPRLRVVRALRPGISAARNAGVAQARGEIVAFTDDDVRVDRGWLRALASRFRAEPDVDCVTGLVLPAELETDEQVWYERNGPQPIRRYRPGTYHIAARGLTGLRPWDRRRFEVLDRTQPGNRSSLYQLGPFGTGANMTFRTAVVRELGGFDESLGAGTLSRGGEDIAMFVRLLYSGRCLAFEPAAYVFHTHRRTYPELCGQVNGYGRGLSAMLSAVVRERPGHIFGLLRVAPAGLRMAAGRGRRAEPASPALPVGDLRRARVSGLLFGPVAQVLTQRRMRRWNW